MPTGELYKHVNDFCNVAGGTSLAGIHRALQKDMNHGKWTWKKPVAEKFSPENLNYCQEFVNSIYLHYAFNSENKNLQLITVVVHCWHPLCYKSMIRYNQVTTNNQVTT